ncbi:MULTISPECIES: alpha/beta fold hydrolase [Streptomyces]|uniref:alpha/beta fold hydrolase n=1 Tax=Streptomyces TaxID=1883 RepID=UPI00163BE3C0|nr:MULTISPECIES: alpha/beta hydrolase [Streptomyces]MBC2875444.1 alpha/beta hydrolase [Streptomyces sp. TYQ1024]UBI35683.1 alpha/beta hydrolase [Streptomyces mobaraensis]UKW28277.1 alpha/beta hydrolase [Streptomyces sp. TYQ1024]
MEQTIQKRLPVGGGDSWVTIDVYGRADAPGLVVVPGAMSDARAWRDVARSIDAWPSVSVVNRRGRAPSGPLTDAYSLRAEIDDLAAVLDELPPAQALFGWSYGGLIALLATEERPPRQVIAYEPVVRPFGGDVLPDLRSAAEAEDWDTTVDIVNRRIAGLDAAHVESLRADHETWATLCRLSVPAYAELAALNAVVPPDAWGRGTARIDLIVGERNHGRAPYGTSFDDVRKRVPHAEVHILPGQGHMAHLEAPAGLAGLLDKLAAPRPSTINHRNDETMKGSSHGRT